MNALYPISPTKVGTWLDCPRRFRLQYVEKVRVSSQWAHLSMGNAVHDTLRDWWDVPPAERTRERLATLLAERWRPQGFRDDDQSAQWRSNALSMIWHYLQQLEPGFAPVSCERTLAARTAGQAISGRIDRLDADPDDPDALVVVDYKTGRRVPGDDDVRGSLALALYAMCVQQTLRRPCTRVELHHIPSGVRVGRELSAESLDRQRRRVEQIGAEMAAAESAWRADGDDDAHFPANPGPLCAWCDFRAHCPEGSAAAPAKTAWAGLPESAEDAPQLS